MKDLTHGLGPVALASAAVVGCNESKAAPDWCQIYFGYFRLNLMCFRVGFDSDRNLEMDGSC